MRKLADLHPTPVTFALYRYRHLYVVQRNQVTILDQDASLRRVTLEFSPSTWASYGGSVTLYDPESGIAQFSGDDLTLVEAGDGPYTAPYGMAMKQGKAIQTGESFEGAEINGLPIEPFGPITRSEHLGVTFENPITGALIDKGQHLVFTNSKDSFALLNGIKGDLLYAQPPELLVPYVYPQNGLFGAGCSGGYLFTPDQGISWRIRKLNGWGVLTESAILQVSVNGGVQVVRGWWL